eukprot:SAG31_NODE_1646_length_7649_cov_3.317616_5_plen_177_part_00
MQGFFYVGKPVAIDQSRGIAMQCAVVRRSKNFFPRIAKHGPVLERVHVLAQIVTVVLYFILDKLLQSTAAPQNQMTDYYCEVSEANNVARALRVVIRTCFYSLTKAQNCFFQTGAVRLFRSVNRFCESRTNLLQCSCSQIKPAALIACVVCSKINQNGANSEGINAILIRTTTSIR